MKLGLGLGVGGSGGDGGERVSEASECPRPWAGDNSFSATGGVRQLQQQGEEM